jgi:FkbM family methyltransferase
VGENRPDFKELEYGAADSSKMWPLCALKELSMNPIRRLVRFVPALRQPLKRIYTWLFGVPPLTLGGISKDVIQGCIGRRDPLILEIGCNDGTHTLWFLKMFDSPTIHCFEPDPRAVQRFHRKVGERPNVQLHELAISDREGEIVFYQSSGSGRNEQHELAMPQGWDLSGSIRKPKEHLVEYPWVRFDSAIQVRTTTLDAWCARNGVGPIDFIWMDVQGAEMDVFRGGARALARTRYVYTEYSDTELYEGQSNLAALRRGLPSFKVLIRYRGDVLLENTAQSQRPNSQRLP